jgi:hypothetical protein
LSARSVAPVPTVQVYVVSVENALPGVKVIVFPLQPNVPVGVALFIRNALSTDDLFIVSLNVTETVDETATCVALSDGVIRITVGAVTLVDSVVKLHIFADAREFPVKSSAPVSTLQVYVVFNDNALPGIKVIVFPLQLKSPITAGLIVNASCADDSFIDSLKVTATVGKVATSTAPFDGVTEDMVGAAESSEYAVVKLHVYADAR